MRSLAARDDALSSVVAFLLLLTVVVSFISLLNAYYIPSLKQQEEAKHLSSVEEMFRSISGDVSSMTMFQKEGSFQRHTSLGGGAALFSPVTSSGTLKLEEKPFLKLFIQDMNGETKSIDINITVVSYEPIGNFWVNQGYIWKRGLVYVTKSSKQTWLEHVTAEDAKKAEQFFLKTVFTPQTLTNSSLSVYTLTADPNAFFRSGNGMSGINMSMTGTSQVFYGVVDVELATASGDLETLILLDDLINEWKPSFTKGTDLTVEVYEIRMRVV
jgi:hypothetical protein